MTQDNENDDGDQGLDGAPYEVGYGRPPKATRFKPGKSGNPGGRPKGSGKAKNTDLVVEKMKALVLEEAYRPIQIRDGDRLVELPVMQAILRSLALNAAKGQPRAQRMLIDLLGAVEAGRRTNREQLFAAVVDYKQQCKRKIDFAHAAGLPEPRLLPHPDALIVDPFSGSVISRGPWTPEEKAERDKLELLKRQLQARIAKSEAKLRQVPRDADLLRRVGSLKSVIARIDAELNFEQVLVPGFR